MELVRLRTIGALCPQLLPLGAEEVTGHMRSEGTGGHRAPPVCSTGALKVRAPIPTFSSAGRC